MLETIIKMHESMVGVFVYSILMQFECVNISSPLSIISFIVMLFVLAYLILVTRTIWQQLNSSKHSKDTSYLK